MKRARKERRNTLGAWQWRRQKQTIPWNEDTGEIPTRSDVQIATTTPIVGLIWSNGMATRFHV
eukprot:9050280-Lingulodinium_polyedra.AAC.1